MRARLVIADDHPFILDGLEQLFSREHDLEIVARCLNGEEALAAVARFSPEILILDVRMPVCDGIDVMRQLKNGGAATKVVLLTASMDDARLLEAFRLGAAGIVLKEMAPRLLVRCVRKVLAGERGWDQVSVVGALQKMIYREERREELGGVLTGREMEITRMVAVGMRNKEIAQELAISEGTVKSHLHAVYEKLRIDGRFALIKYARDNGLA